MRLGILLKLQLFSTRHMFLQQRPYLVNETLLKNPDQSIETNLKKIRRSFDTIKISVKLNSHNSDYRFDKHGSSNNSLIEFGYLRADQQIPDRNVPVNHDGQLFIRLIANSLLISDSTFPYP